MSEMVSGLTRGGLVPAVIENLVSGTQVKCMFNPYEYTLSKSNSWNKSPVTGQNVPEVTFKQGGSQTLKLTLHFDGLQSQEDVRKYTEPLWKMMMVDQTQKTTYDKSQPPEVAFSWGKLYFKSVISSMSQKFTLFNAEGIPMRCTVDITFEQLIEEDNYKGSQAQFQSRVTVKQPTVAQAGDRIDNVAHATGTSHRELSERNNIDNPLNIPPGTSYR
jgi:hypothetical protein